MSDVRLRSDLRGAPPGRSVPDLDPPVSFEAVGVLLQGLDGPQRRAVTHGEGPLLVVAGPGTGKTRVVSHRIAWLVATRRARPSEILGLTFTDRAADEMQERVDRLVPYGYNDTAVHTFHAFGDSLVREHAFRLGLPDQPRLLARAEAVIFLRDHLFELGLERFRPLGDPTRFLEALVALFGRAKEEDVWPSDYRAHADRLAARAAAASSAAADDGSRDAAAALTELAANQTELATAYERYQTLMGAAGAIDFGDQIALAVRLLREARDVRTTLQRRFRYVLVDEFQDTDPAQLELIRLLIGSRRNVTAVGDDDQAIYTFRGAALDKGDEVRVYAPGGALVGKFIVERTGAGEYGFLPIYGDDPYSKEKDGAGAGDVLRIALYRVSDGKEYPVLYSSVDPLPFKASMEGARVDLMF